MHPGPEVVKIFMVNPAEYEHFLLINIKMPSILGISTFMDRKTSILGLSEPDKNKYIDIFMFLNI